MYLIQGIFSIFMVFEDQYAYLGSNSPAGFVTMSSLHLLSHGKLNVGLQFNALWSVLVCQAPLSDAASPEDFRC